MRACDKAEFAFDKLRELKTYVKEGEQQLIKCYLLSGEEERAVKYLTEVLKNNDTEAHGDAIKKLGETKHPKAVAPLIDILIKDHSYPAAYALAEIGLPAIGPLETALQSKNKTVRILVLIALDHINNPRTMQSFILGLRDEDPDIRVLSAYYLGSKEDARALIPLAEALKDKNVLVRDSAADALVEINDPKTPDYLAILLKNGTHETKNSANKVLKKINENKAAGSKNSLL